MTKYYLFAQRLMAEERNFTSSLVFHGSVQIGFSSFVSINAQAATGPKLSSGFSTLFRKTKDHRHHRHHAIWIQIIPDVPDHRTCKLLAELFYVPRPITLDSFHLSS
jgi:hypothetical protein